MGRMTLLIFTVSINRPILSEGEIKWLLDQLDRMGKELPDLSKRLKSMKTSSDRGFSLASLLVDSKQKRRILNEEEKKQTLAFLMSKEDFPDKECRDLLYDLRESVESRSVIIPDFDTEKEIVTAIKEGIEYFSEKMEDRVFTVLAYYAYAQVSRYLQKNSPENLKRAKVSVRMVAKKLSPGFRTSEEDRLEMSKAQTSLAKILFKVFNEEDANDIQEFTNEGLKLISQTYAIEYKIYIFSGKFWILDVIAADVLGYSSPAMKDSVTMLTTDPDFKILCPGIDLLVSRMKRRIKADEKSY
jgi:hypothetical protein